MVREFEKTRLPAADCSLIGAVAGELGNNAFDHNIGHWSDSVGCALAYGRAGGQRWFVVADRGRGVLASLKKVRPGLENDQAALDVAFTERITSRSPELRGNGLKFVRSTINTLSDAGLFYQSGSGVLTFGRSGDLARERIPKTVRATRRGVYSFVVLGQG